MEFGWLYRDAELSFSRYAHGAMEAEVSACRWRIKALVKNAHSHAHLILIPCSLWEIATRRDPYKKRRRKLRISEFELASRIARDGLRPHIPAAGIQPLKLLTLIKAMWDQDSEKRPSFEYAHRILEEIKSERMQAHQITREKGGVLPGTPVPVPGISSGVPSSGPGPIAAPVHVK